MAETTTPKSTRVAKLVTIVLTTRVVVDESANDEQIFETARKGFANKLHEESLDNIEKIELDTECPFGTFETDK